VPVIGLLTVHTGYPVAFLLTAALITPALIPALREQAPQAAAGIPATDREREPTTHSP
jgi:hypothetical protein